MISILPVAVNWLIIYSVQSLLVMPGPKQQQPAAV